MLEITESSILEQDKISRKTIESLCKLGITFALDDFGMGYSSMSYLKELPISILKIDRGFIKNIMGNKSDHVIVSSIVALAKGLGIKVIAEGVETQLQMNCLQACGCHLMHGHLFGTPMSVSEVESEQVGVGEI